MQGVPDPASFSAADSWGLTAGLVFIIFVLIYLLWRAEKRTEAADGNCDELRGRYEESLKESIRDYKERDRTLELITKRDRPDG